MLKYKFLLTEYFSVMNSTVCLAGAEEAVLTKEVLEMQTARKKHVPKMSMQHIVMHDVLFFHNRACSHISEQHLQLPQSAKFRNFAMILILYNKRSLKCCFYTACYVFPNPFMFSTLQL